MFRAPLSSASGESIVLIRHLVYVTVCRWPSSVQVWMEQRPVSRNDRPSECRYTDGFIPIRRNLSWKVKTILLKVEMMKRRNSEHTGSRTFRTVALDIWEDAACSSSHRTLKKVIHTTRSKREQCTANCTALYRAQEQHSTASPLSVSHISVLQILKLWTFLTFW